MPEMNQQVLLKRGGAQWHAGARRFPRSLWRPLSEPGEGQVLLRASTCPSDPYMRGRISGQRSYATPTEIGDVIEGRVCRSGRDGRPPPAFREGDFCVRRYGWQTHSVVNGDALTKLDPAQGIAFKPHSASSSSGPYGLWRPEDDRPSLRRVRRLSSPRPRGQSAALPDNWPARRFAVSSASPGAPTVPLRHRELGFDACVEHRGDRSWLGARSGLSTKASTFISRMSAATYSARFIRGSTISAHDHVWHDRRVQRRRAPAWPQPCRRGCASGSKSKAYHRPPTMRALPLRVTAMAMAAPMVRSGQLKYREDNRRGHSTMRPRPLYRTVARQEFRQAWIIKLGADPTR